MAIIEFIGADEHLRDKEFLTIEEYIKPYRKLEKFLQSQLKAATT